MFKTFPNQPFNHAYAPVNNRVPTGNSIKQKRAPTKVRTLFCRFLFRKYRLVARYAFNSCLFRGIHGVAYAKMGATLQVEIEHAANNGTVIKMQFH